MDIFKSVMNVDKTSDSIYLFARRIIVMFLIVVYVLPVLICSARVSEKWWMLSDGVSLMYTLKIWFACKLEHLCVTGQTKYYGETWQLHAFLLV